MATEKKRLQPLSRGYDIITGDRRIIYVQSLLFVVALWHLAAYQLNLVDTISAPIPVFAETYELYASGAWIEHTFATLRRALIAFAITIGLATGLGLLLGLSDRWERGFRNYVTVAKGAPPLMIVIFAAMWFGFGELTPIIGAALSTFPFMAENLYEGINDIDNDLYAMAGSFDVSRERVIRRVVLQSIFPAWVAGLRYTFAICWKIVTLGEVIAAQNGIGFMIRTQMEFLDMTTLLAWVLVFVIVVFVIEYGLFQPLENRLLAYRPEVNVVTAG